MNGAFKPLIHVCDGRSIIPKTITIHCGQRRRAEMGHPRRILVVDDNLINREIIEEILRDDFTVITASNGSEALELADRYEPRVVLLDVMLPGMDGYSICRKLRAMPEMSTARIVMVTAKAMPSERAQGFE